MAGTVVMAGTPSGVGSFMYPPGYIKLSYTVVIRITGLAICHDQAIF